MNLLLRILMLKIILLSSTLVVADETIKPTFQHCNKYSLSDGGLTTVLNEIAQELGRRLNASVENLNAPIKRCLSMLKTGEVDFMFNVLSTEERSKYVDYILPSDGVDNVFLVRKSEGDWLHSFSDLKSKSIGLVEGYFFITKINTATDIKKQFVVEPTKLPKMLLSGRVDAFVLDEGRANKVLLDYPSLIKATYREQHVQRNFIGISKVSHLHHRLDEVKHVILAMIDDGYIHERLEQYMPGLKSPFSKSTKLN